MPPNDPVPSRAVSPLPRDGNAAYPMKPASASSSSRANNLHSILRIHEDDVVEVIPNKLYYATMDHSPPIPPSSRASLAASSASPDNHLPDHYFSIDRHLIYWNFFLDFGPLNLGQLYRFSVVLRAKLKDPKFGRVVFHSATNPQRRANAITLIGCFAILYLGQTADEAYRRFAHIQVAPFHDATAGFCSYNLSVLDCLRGFEKAKKLKFVDFDNFDVEEYEHFEKVENGDLSWVFPGRFIAFAGPHDVKSADESYPTNVPEDYVPYFRRHRVTLVVRLNKSYYHPNRFIKAGINHFDLYFPDGSCPADDILNQFLVRAEAVPQGEAIAVHCKAGLGRTGTCIGAYAMKHWGFTAAEVIGWMRIVRPGSVIGPQQQYLEAIEARMHREGMRMRAFSSSCSSSSSSISFYSSGTSLLSASAFDAVPASASSPQGGEEMGQVTARVPDEVTQGDLLLTAKVRSPHSPDNEFRKRLAEDANAASSPPESRFSLRNVARKLTGKS